jgi:hypothetical protein
MREEELEVAIKVRVTDGSPRVIDFDLLRLLTYRYIEQIQPFPDAPEPRPG